MRTIAVHPEVMQRFRAGRIQTILTRYEVDEGEEVELVSDDEVVSLRTKVLGVHRVSAGLFEIVVDDPATAFVERSDDDEEGETR